MVQPESEHFFMLKVPLHETKTPLDLLDGSAVIDRVLPIDSLERIDPPGAERDIAFNLLEATAFGCHDVCPLCYFAPGSLANAFSAAL